MFDFDVVFPLIILYEVLFGIADVHILHRLILNVKYLVKPTFSVLSDDYFFREGIFDLFLNFLLTLPLRRLLELVDSLENPIFPHQLSGNVNSQDYFSSEFLEGCWKALVYLVTSYFLEFFWGEILIVANFRKGDSFHDSLETMVEKHQEFFLIFDRVNFPLSYFDSVFFVIFIIIKYD